MTVGSVDVGVCIRWTHHTHTHDIFLFSCSCRLGMFTNFTPSQNQMPRAPAPVLTFDGLGGEVGPDGRSVADCERLNAERVRCSSDQVPDPQPSLPAAPHVHRHHFTHSCSRTTTQKQNHRHPTHHLLTSIGFFCVCVHVCVQTLHRGSVLVDHPVAFQLSVGRQRRSPGHVDASFRHLREGQEAGLAGRWAARGKNDK